MKRTSLTRKPAKRKRRAPGVGCRQPGKTCRRNAVVTVDGIRLCPKHGADRLMGKKVRARGFCEHCHSDQSLQWAHIWSRRYGAIRWAEDNSMCLCAGCHQFYTLRPAEWEQWCREKGVPWDELRFAALNDEPMDPLEVIAKLTIEGVRP